MKSPVGLIIYNYCPHYYYDLEMYLPCDRLKHRGQVIQQKYQWNVHTVKRTITYIYTL